MTSASSSTDKIKKAGYLPLFSNMLRQKWTTMLLSAIIMFFTLPVPVLMIISIYKNNAEQYKLDPLPVYMLEWGRTIRYALIPLMAILGVIMVCSVTRYLKKRETVDFYHSLPVSRGQLYTSWLLAGLTLLIVPLIIMSAVTLIILAANGALSLTLFNAYMLVLGESLVYMLLLGGIAALVGMISGTTVVHLLLCGMTVFIIPLFYWAVVYFISIFNENMWVSWYYNAEIMARMSPALRFLMNTDPLEVTEIIIWLILAAAMYIGGCFVYRIRRSERAGNPIVFKPVGEVIKYLLVIMMTLLGGTFFYEVMYNFGWTVFGMVCGALLTFMLANSVLAKTAKAMLRGWKSLCVYGGICVGLMCVLIFNLFGINSSIPTENNLTRVDVMFENGLGTMSFRNDEVMAALRQLYTESDWSEPYGYYESYAGDPNDKYDYTYEYMNADSQHICFVFYPKFGLPQAKAVTINNKSEFADELRILLDSEEFRQQFAESMSVDRISTLRKNTQVYDYLVKNRLIQKIGEYDYYTSEFQNSFIKAAASDIEAVGYDTFQKAQLGYVTYIPNGQYRSSFFYLSAATPEMNKLLYGADPTPYMDDFYKSLAEDVAELKVTRISDGRECVITSKDELCEIFASLYTVDDILDVSPFTVIDTEYAVEYTNVNEDITYDENGDEVTTIENTHVISYFLRGQVPAFIAERMQ